MAVKVIILRHFTDEQKNIIQPILQQLHQKALQSGGYVSGESLVNSGNREDKLVISTWNTRADWERFEGREDCLALHQQVDSIIEVQTVYQVYDTDY